MNATRFNFIRLIILILFALALFKAYRIAIVEHNYYLKRYTKRIIRTVTKQGRRGAIFGGRGSAFALDYPVYTLFVDPVYFKNDIAYRVRHGHPEYPERVKRFIDKLARILGVNAAVIDRMIDEHPSSHYVVISKRISQATYKKIVNADMPPSFGFIRRFKRYYPDGEYSAHNIGFCFSNSHGAEGLERYYDRFLMGRRISDSVALDAFKGLPLPPLKPGYDLHISLIKGIQDYVHMELAKTVKEHDAKSGTVIVMDPYTGAIIAMDSYPFYDNNHYSRYPYSDIRNRAVADVFEPGSVFKLITMSAALDSGKFKGNEIVYCENGRWKLGRRIIHDVHRFGWLSFRNVFVYSSNIGSAKIALKLGKKIFYRYLYLYGFGSRTGIDTISEAKGLLKDIMGIGRIDLATMAFGQGIGVTEIQLAVAYSVIANGGYRVRPHFMEWLSLDGKRSLSWKVQKVRILKPSTVRIIRSILTDVVKRGTGKRAALKDYVVAGKTGTAQIPKHGSYNTRQYVASFAGFAPANRPRLVVVVSIFNPEKGGFYGGVVAAPLFAKIMEYSLHYLGVPPASR